MDVLLNRIFFPVSFNELFSVWNQNPSALPYAGGTVLLWKQSNTIIDLPPVIICLDNMQELQKITRTEHYLEIGSMVKLNKIITLGKIVPEILCDCLENIGGVQLRNVATIGGNICCTTQLLDISAPLVALDAQYEFRNAQSSRWVSALRYHSEEEHNALEKKEILTRIRLPLHQWDYSMYKKFYSEGIYSNKTVTFLAKVQKDILSDIKIVCKGDTIVRNKNAEGILIGSHLPLHRKTAADFVENWKEFLSHNDEIDEFSKYEIINCIEINVYNLSE
ncbi:MAG: FAD binding domain-containing protein [Treponema sp.]|jgi:CO/xanthine dehydrogenase FAD-binding subunit|nr:FAD binding domain-containing protein [Treponema sp.]